MRVLAGTRRPRSATIDSRWRTTARSGSGSAKGMGQSRNSGGGAGAPPPCLFRRNGTLEKACCERSRGVAARAATVSRRFWGIDIRRANGGSEHGRHREACPVEDGGGGCGRCRNRRSAPVRAPAQDGSAADGADVFKKCRACHDVGPDAKNNIGPFLNGIVGRRAGTIEGFNYSVANKEAAARAWCGPRRCCSSTWRRP
jgi:hypothetical protein